MPEKVRRISQRVWRYIAHYLYGLFAKSWNSSVGAVDAFIGLAVGAAVTSQIQAIDWRGALAVFGTTWVRAALLYFKENPIPEQFPGATHPPFARGALDSTPPSALPPTDPRSFP
jgi:hypothetical protein